MTDWQPIETIPKGEPDEFGDSFGPLVLVWMPKKGYPWIARWVEQFGKTEICSTYSECMSEEDGYSGWHIDLNGPPEYSPTHWATLPEGPQ